MPKNVAAKKRASSPVTKSSKAKAKTTKKVSILPCLANLHKAGIKNVPRQQLESLTGYTKGSLRVTLGKLRKKGEVEWDDNQTARLTKAGWEFVGQDNDAGSVTVSNDETQARIKETYKLSGAKAEIFDLLLDGAAHRIVDIMKSVNCSNPDSFRVFCSALVSKNIAERIKDPTSGDKMLKLADICFPFGRPVHSFEGEVVV